MNKLILGILCIAMMGCSAKQKIYDTAERVRTTAQGIEAVAINIAEITTNPEVVPLAESIVKDAQSIQVSAEVVKEATTHVKDIVPWWVLLLERGFLLAIIVAGIYFTWVYIVPIRMLIGRFLPARRRAAKMIRKVASGAIDHSEFVANWRADPANEAAYRAEKKRDKLNAPK